MAIGNRTVVAVVVLMQQFHHRPRMIAAEKQRPRHRIGAQLATHPAAQSVERPARIGRTPEQVYPLRPGQRRHARCTLSSK